MLVVEAESFGLAWIKLLGELVAHGMVQMPRGQRTKELVPVTFHVRDGYQNILESPLRKLGYRFMVAEWLWILSGRNDVESISLFNNNIAKFSDDGATFFGAYGPIIALQLEWAIKKLVEDNETRQAVISIWRQCPPETKDVPCTLTVQFLARDGFLHTVVNMRSSDVWLGLPYDFFNFSMFGNLVASALQIGVGSVTFNLGSSHLYQRDMPHAIVLLIDRKLQNGSVFSPSLGVLTSYGEPHMRLVEMILSLKVAFDNAVLFRQGLTEHSYLPEPALAEVYFKALTAKTNEEARSELVTAITR
jgi:thymidylate synthase